MGIQEADFMKPKIAVVNSSSTLSVCYIHLDGISRIVQQAIREAGGLPFEIRTAAPSDFITSAGLKARYLMPTRDLVINDIEDTVYFARLYLEQQVGEQKVILEIDSRPSDCITLALMHNLPVFCRKEILEKAVPVEED